jgi:hypothetical protein
VAGINGGLSGDLAGSRTCEHLTTAWRDCRLLLEGLDDGDRRIISGRALHCLDCQRMLRVGPRRIPDRTTVTLLQES